MTSHGTRNIIRRSVRKPTVYSIVTLVWITVMGLYEYLIYIDSILPILKKRLPLEILLVFLNQIFVAAFFFFSITNLIIAIFYVILKNKVKEEELEILSKELPLNWKPKVQLLYTTYNDFLPYAFLQCLNQTYSNLEGIILDNSTDAKYIEKVDKFIIAHPEVKLIRKSNNKHAKAGNLNNYLCNEGKGSYDYIVILDSDELLENRFVEKCLKIFFYTDIGILQCNHISGQNHNSFMRSFSKSGNIFWPVQNVVRSAEGGWLSKSTNKDNEVVIDVDKAGGMLCIELGHGVMISSECFDDIGQIPHAVAEDLCTSLEATLKGWNIKFASQIYGNEAFPVNMNALIIRSSKFCSANLEFIKKYFFKIINSSILSFFQKIDIFCFTLYVPICVFQYFSLVLSSIFFPILHIPLVTQVIMLIPVLICYFSQSIIDGIFQVSNGMNFFRMIVYEIESTILYGSFYYIAIKSTILAIMNKPAKFNVTPKVNAHVSIKKALKNHWEGIIFSVITIGLCIDISGTSWVLIAFLPGCLGFLFELKANRQDSEDKKKEKRFELYSEHAITCKRGFKVIDWYE